MQSQPVPGPYESYSEVPLGGAAVGTVKSCYIKTEIMEEEEDERLSSPSLQDQEENDPLGFIPLVQLQEGENGLHYQFKTEMAFEEEDAEAWSAPVIDAVGSLKEEEQSWDHEAYMDGSFNQTLENPLEEIYCTKNFVCTVCGRVFKTLGSLKGHVTKSHNDFSVTTQDNEVKLVPKFTPRYRPSNPKDSPGVENVFKNICSGLGLFKELKSSDDSTPINQPKTLPPIKKPKNSILINKPNYTPIINKPNHSTDCVESVFKNICSGLSKDKLKSSNDSNPIKKVNISAPTSKPKNIAPINKSNNSTSSIKFDNSTPMKKLNTPTNKSNHSTDLPVVENVFKKICTDMFKNKPKIEKYAPFTLNFESNSSPLTLNSESNFEPCTPNFETSTVAAASSSTSIDIPIMNSMKRKADSIDLFNFQEMHSPTEKIDNDLTPVIMTKRKKLKNDLQKLKTENDDKSISKNNTDKDLTPTVKKISKITLSNVKPRKENDSKNKSSSSDAGIKFSCTECTATFKIKFHLDRHIYIHHSKNRKVLLQTYETKKQSDFNPVVHDTSDVQLEKGTKRLRCRWCKETFKSPSFLNVHIRTHKDEWPFQCSACKKTFLRNYHGTVHIEKQHGGNAELQRVEIHPKISPNIPITSLSLQDLRKKVEIENEKKPETDNVKPQVWIQCNVCRVLFENENMMMKHCRLYHSPTVNEDSSVGVQSMPSSLSSFSQNIENEKESVENENTDLIKESMKSLSTQVKLLECSVSLEDIKKEVLYIEQTRLKSTFLNIFSSVAAKEKTILPNNGDEGSTQQQAGLGINNTEGSVVIKQEEGSVLHTENTDVESDKIVNLCLQSVSMLPAPLMALPYFPQTQNYFDATNKAAPEIKLSSLPCELSHQAKLTILAPYNIYHDHNQQLKLPTCEEKSNASSSEDEIQYDDHGSPDSKPSEDEEIEGLYEMEMAASFKSLSFTCDTCGKIFQNENVYKRHIRFHQTDESLVCCVCSQSMPSRNDLSQHYANHKAESALEEIRKESQKQTQSQTSGKSRPRSRRLPVAPNFPQSSSDYACYFCPRTFTEESIYKHHIKTHHDEYELPSSSPQFRTEHETGTEPLEESSTINMNLIKKEITDTNSDDEIPCLMCNLKFHSSHELIQHYCGVHQNEKRMDAIKVEKNGPEVEETIYVKDEFTEEVDDVNDTTEFIEQDSNKDYDDAVAFTVENSINSTVHTLITDEPSASESYASSSAELFIGSDNDETIKEIAKVYGCHISNCNRQFNDLEAATTHQKNAHKKMLLCPYCNAAFVSKSNVNTHVHKLHADLKSKTTGSSTKITSDSNVSPRKNFLCSICRQEFRTMKEAMVHKLTHTPPVVFQSCLSNQNTTEEGINAPEDRLPDAAASLNLVPYNDQNQTSSVYLTIANTTTEPESPKTTQGGIKYRCSRCSNLFNSEDEFIQHLTKEHGVKGFRNVNGKYFQVELNKNTSKVRVKKYKKYAKAKVCPMCHKKFVHFKRHLRVHGMQEEDIGDSDEVDEGESFLNNQPDAVQEESVSDVVSEIDDCESSGGPTVSSEIVDVKVEEVVDNSSILGI